jgi:hypothetical protein
MQNDQLKVWGINNFPTRQIDRLSRTRQATWKKASHWWCWEWLFVGALMRDTTVPGDPIDGLFTVTTILEKDKYQLVPLWPAPTVCHTFGHGGMDDPCSTNAPQRHQEANRVWWVFAGSLIDVLPWNVVLEQPWHARPQPHSPQLFIIHASMLKHTCFTALRHPASQGRVNRYRRRATSIDLFTKRIVALIITLCPAISMTSLTQAEHR